MTKQRILVVDDEQDLCEILLFNLRAAGYEADAAYSGDEALELVHSSEFIVHSSEFIVHSSESRVHSYDLLLLDVMMPGMSGFELARRLKQDAPTAHLPIIFLTAKDGEDDLLRGFGLGADDYVTKPFSVREVMARVKAVLSRSSQPQPSQEMLNFDQLAVDLAGKRVTVDGQDVALTKTEFELLVLLLRRQGQVLSRQELLEGAWPENVVVTDRTVDVNLARLRKKLGRYAANIIARTGFGYCFQS